MYAGSNQRSVTGELGRRQLVNPYDTSGNNLLGTRNTSAAVYQSTPKAKVSPPSILNSMNYHTSVMRISSPPKQSVSFASSNVLGRTSPAHGGQVRSPSPSRSPMRSWSPTKVSETEMSTMQKQRKELQLLIGELKDRDRELNEMVTSHQKQLIAWETDRQRVLVLEKNCAKLKAEVKRRTEQVKQLREKVKTAESEGHSKSKELESTQIHLQQMSEQANVSTQQVQELQERNENLTGSVQELSSQLGQLQAREQELVTVLKLKESDIREANIRISELTQKLKKVQSALQETKKAESSSRNERDQLREQFLANKNELERLKADINKQANDSGEHQAELSQIKQETLVLQKELFLAGEREKRKDQLLELSKSKQERTDTELQHIRQLYERQQRDLLYLQHQLQSQESSDALDRYSEITTDDEGSSIIPFNKLNSGDKVALPFSDIGSRLTDQEKGLEIQDLRGEDDDVELSELYKPTISSKTMPIWPRAPARISVSTNFGKTVTSPNGLSAFESDGSPTSRLHKLLAESRQMVQTLEENSPFSSTHTTPEQQKHLGNDKLSPEKDSHKSPSPNATIGSLTLNMNGYCSDTSN